MAVCGCKRADRRGTPGHHLGGRSSFVEISFPDAISSPQLPAKSSKSVNEGEPNPVEESHSEYLLQRSQRGGERLCRDYSQFLRQPGLVHGTNLIEQDQALPATMSYTDPPR